jgi:hypothetical protein
MSNGVPTSTAVPPYKLKVGYNLPFTYNNCGYDIGPDPQDYKRQDPKWMSTLGPNLAKLRAAGIEVVRWFILANGFNYGFHPDWHSGLVRNYWTFTPPDPPDPRFFKHFEMALKIFQENGMKLIPSLVSFEFFGPSSYNGPVDPVKPNPDVHDFTAGGRADVANDPVKRSSFFKTLLEPMLTTSEQYRDAIFAWEVMNEPTWVTGHVGPGQGAYVNEANLIAFLQEGVDMIDKHKLPSTVGHRYYSDLQKYPTGKKKQFHYYPSTFNNDPDPLPREPGAFMGEFGAEHPGQYPHGSLDPDPGGTWPGCWQLDKDPKQVVQRRLQLLEALRYELALVWPDLAPGDDVSNNNALRITPDKLEHIRKFTSGQRTP